MKRADKIIRYQAHALRRMAQRGVTSTHVASALRNPDAERPAKRKDARRFEKVISKRRRVVVIASESASDFWVISAWWN